MTSARLVVSIVPQDWASEISWRLAGPNGEPVGPSSSKPVACIRNLIGPFAGDVTLSPEWSDLIG